MRDIPSQLPIRNTEVLYVVFDAGVSKKVVNKHRGKDEEVDGAKYDKSLVPGNFYIDRSGLITSVQH